MSWEQENDYKRFISYIKILGCRANEKARRLNDEETKKEAEEYCNTYKKLEKIRERKFFTLANEENKDKTLYEEISELSYNTYKDIDSIDTKSSDEKLKMLYNEIKAMISDYKIEKEQKKSEEKEIKGETER